MKRYLLQPQMKNILYKKKRFKEVILLEYIILLSLDMVGAYPIWITKNIEKKWKKMNEMDDSHEYEYHHYNIGLRKILTYMKQIFQYFLFIWKFWQMGIKRKQLSFQHRFRTRRMFGRWQWWYKPRWAFWGRIIVRIIEAFRY